MEPLPKNAFRNTSALPTTPSAPLRWLSIFILDGAATPPVSGGELPASHSFTASKTAPINITWTGYPEGLRRTGTRSLLPASAQGVVKLNKRHSLVQHGARKIELSAEMVRLVRENFQIAGDTTTIPDF